MRKVIALDIDGTLFNDHKEITEQTKTALIRAQQAGAILVLASGRPVAGLRGIARALEMEHHHGLLLGYNGGMVTDAETGVIICDDTIPQSLARKLLRHLEAYPVTPIVDNGSYIYTDNPEGFQIAYESATNDLPIRRVDNICDSLDFSPAKVLIAAPELIMREYQEALMEPFAETLSGILSTPFYLEVTPPGVNKADAMTKVCEKLDIPQQDVIAFGDAQNDISMVAAAGTGVAMGNACEELKTVADLITASNNEDGIAAALEQLGVI